ncbi:alpha/beta hydrolase family protein [Bradyrhizobium sp. CCBAU 45384]|uniref:alpha/beta hydrolase family protein n=1 Tax=Bradyrhizobium sp. CCBAU 45384 TaxID=858428 RepID=UPI002306A995|nr:alpha/beta fold hydrolase [Bradyrhizobium sp. CCBAU 45384]
MRLDPSSSKAATWASLLTLAGFCIVVLKITTMPLPLVERHVGPAELPHGTDNQQLWWVPASPSGLPAPDAPLLETTVYRPRGTGPFALVVISHGKPKRNFSGVEPGFETAAHWFVDQGFVVVVPLRQGYGRSEGGVNDMVGTCDTMDYFATAKQTARDIEAVVAFMQRQSFIDPNNIVVVGHSHGGFGALGVASDAPNGVRGVINFAGGSGASKRGGFCNGRENLIAALRRLGSENWLPQIWLYALDDETFDSIVAKEMWLAYSSSSHSKILFVALPATGAGHMLFPKGNTVLWEQAVRQFLVQLGMRAD